MSTARPAPPPPKAPPKATAQMSVSNVGPISVNRGRRVTAQRIEIYGPGGIGKSELVENMKKVGIEPLVLDTDNETNHLNVDRVDVADWQSLRGAVQNQELIAPYGAVVIDNMSKAQQLAQEYAVANIPHEKGHTVSRFEDYGFGKGYSHVYELMLSLLGDLDAVVRSGKHVVLVAHDCVSQVPNPAGEDYQRYEPRLNDQKNGNVRSRVREWVDHCLYVGYDVYAKDNKGQGAGTRTIYTTELPSWIAKSRYLSEPIPYEKGSCELWKQLFSKGA